ncbi:TetR/AcrR family transcriptional regulator [Coraliomargarita sp. SDUM461003]|uniref:TetR/AcrR family transcriptional regulator n=2 Tax=Thalassobacterium TaxID=3410851 RepID=A0ABU1AY00_9BACT|nr:MULTISPECIES: TetR/AcrR family transcriptional regulator [unclassified Coraliomargarita]MDQ8194498.1 TetR/AcrR family transcriptional regulator [Coraliomargarita sp. SDUM461004]MDQ8208983.1 TetR/AcrR family transcriptional regulator [Coraliomargarita sp. SDUM461003]
MNPSDTKTALLDSAQDLIQRVGVNAMSYNDLSVAVGIRKASIHYHFPKKEDLIRALLLRCGEDYAAHYRAVARSNQTVMEKLQAIADIFESSLKNGKICLVGMLSVESTTLPESVQTTLESTVNGCVGVIESIFIQGVSEGSFSDSMQTAEAAHAYHDCLLGAQIMARCLQNVGHFSAHVRTYLKMLARA